MEASNHPGFKVGDWVLSANGWQDYALSDGSGLARLGESPEHPSYALGLLGMPGFTAYMGLLDIGKPQAGETLVVGAATGPVGATVGQIGKLKGCRVVGVAGGAEKCRHAVQVLGFDACLDHHAADFAERLAEACPDGIDIYYENVGGKVFDAVFPLLNAKAGSRSAVSSPTTTTPTCRPAGPLAGADGHDPAQSASRCRASSSSTTTAIATMNSSATCRSGSPTASSTTAKSGSTAWRMPSEAFFGRSRDAISGKLVVRVGADA